MLPKTLKIHGYRSYVDAVIDFEDYGGVVAIVGQNGAGKSSIIEMITTVLYNRNRCTDDRGAGMDAVINDDCDYFELEFTFVMNNVEYVITSRKHRDESRELELMIDGMDHTEKVVETQRKITDIIRCSYDTFLDTVCIGQGMSARFMEKKPNERREVFAQILNLKRFELYEKEAKERKRLCKVELDEVEAQCKFLEADEVDVDELHKLIDDSTLKLRETNDSLTSAEGELQRVLTEKTQFDEMVMRTKAIIAAREGLQRRVTSAEGDLAKSTASLNVAQAHESEVREANVKQPDVEVLQAKLDVLRDKMSDVKARRGELSVRQAMLSEQRRTPVVKRDRLVNFNEAVCSHCGSTVSPDDKERHVAEAQLEVDAIDEQLQAIAAELKTVEADGKLVANAGREAAEELKNANAAKVALVNAAAEVKRLADAVQFRTTTLADVKQQLAENLFIDVTVPDNVEFHVDELRALVAKLREGAAGLQRVVTVNTERVRTAEATAAKLVELRTSWRTLKDEYADITAVCTAFGKTGAQATIIARDLPEIENEINKVVHVLCDGELSVKFVTSSDVGKGKARHSIDTLEVLVVNAKGTRHYETYSGGERFRVDFACHVGLAKFLARRAGASIDFFIIDEGLGSQDDNARQRFVDTLHKLRTFFKQIICITHINDVQDAFDSRVLVEKDQLTGSRVVVLNNND